MFSLFDKPTRLCDGLNRRELLRVGGLSFCGLSLPALLKAQAAPSAGASDSSSFGRAKNCIFLWLQGGPPQHETFDPKPNAPAEIRGLFRPISTNVPGIQICELLPRTAKIVDKLAIVRSMATDDDIHSSSAYWMLTGAKHDATTARVIRPVDWPYFGSIVKMLRPSEAMPPLSSVWLPDVMRLNDNVQPAGQTAGFIGRRWEPERFICDPSADDFQIEGIGLPPDVPPLRLSRRVDLLTQVERHFSTHERGKTIRQFDQVTSDAFGLLSGGKAREAFAIDREPDLLRARYGQGQWGQCVLLARRLIEAGVRLVHVNWARETGDSVIDNPMWDTHAQNADRLQDVLCPQFDVGFTALIEDLDERGLLEETLVVAVGEFGRTPKINAKGGRDHWGSVFSFVMAGAGIRTAQVYGSSDPNGAYPASGRVEPPDFTATLFHLLGIDRHTMFTDRAGRVLPVTGGTPISAILGDAPATNARREPEGNVALVPPYDDRALWNGDFSEPVPLAEVGSKRRTKGWHAAPLWNAESGKQLSVRLIQSAAAQSLRGENHAALGFGMAAGGEEQIGQGAMAMLTQQVRNPRPGTYTFSVGAIGAANGIEEYKAFLTAFTCRLEIFGYQDLEKDPRRVRVFASTVIEPPFQVADETPYERFELSVELKSQVDNANQTSLGIGVAVKLEKTSPGTFDLPDDDDSPKAFIRIDDVAVQFVANALRKNVKV